MIEDINLTENEELLIDSLLEFALNDDSCPTKKDIRIAGGWVRDKILGMNPFDIDITLEDCNGYNFICHFYKWLKENRSDWDIKETLIKANPAKSKHLETGLLVIPHLKLNVDFVNHRKEEYNELSRIPMIKQGTPLEDALRRDLTINSMFYNLMTKKIEDHSGRGIDDLRNKVLRTPLDPFITLKDDPLRIIRIIRFMSKFHDYQVHNDIIVASKNQEIRDMLKYKVASHRLSQEFAKIFEYKIIEPSFRAMEEWKMWEVVAPIEEGFYSGDLLYKNSDFNKGEYLYAAKYDSIVSDFLKNFKNDVSNAFTPEKSLFTTECFILNQDYNSLAYRGLAIFSIIFSDRFSYQKIIKKNIITVPQQILQCLHWHTLSKKLYNLLVIVHSFLEYHKIKNNNFLEKTKLVHVFSHPDVSIYWEIALLISAILFFRNKSSHEIVEYVFSVREKIMNKYKLWEIWNVSPIFDGTYIKKLIAIHNPSLNPTSIKSIMNSQILWIREHYVNKPNIMFEIKPELEAHLIDQILKYTN